MELIERRTENEFITYRAHPLYPARELLLGLPAYAGWDVGRSVHPSHIAVLLPDNLNGKGFIQIASVWIPLGTPYVKQVEQIKALMRDLRCSSIAYDATRGELEALRELGDLREFKPITFTVERKKLMAGRVLAYLEKGLLKLLPDERQKRSILQVNNMLQAEESEIGHGDSFWSLALALEAGDKQYSCMPRLIRAGARRRGILWRPGSL